MSHTAAASGVDFLGRVSLSKLRRVEPGSQSRTLYSALMLMPGENPVLGRFLKRPRSSMLLSDYSKKENKNNPKMIAEGTAAGGQADRSLSWNS
jgi:hypothetical protein